MIDLPDQAAILREAKLEVVCLNNMARLGVTPRVVPGFERFCVHGFPVGDYLTAGQADVEATYDDEIIGLMAVDATTLRTATYVFRQKSWKEAFEARRRAHKDRARKATPEKDFEDRLAETLRAHGHRVEQQVRVNSGIVDIVDRTARAIVECKAHGRISFVFDAVQQLERYRRDFPGYRLVVGVPFIFDAFVGFSLSAVGIGLVTDDDTDFLTRESGR